MSATSRIAGALFAAAGAVLLTAAPALAETDPPADDAFGITAADTWNFSAAAVCFQEVAVVPALAGIDLAHKNHCVNRNVLNHP